MADTPDLRRNDAQQCYEIHVNGRPAGRLEWRGQGKVLDLVHTEIDRAFEGRGLAGQLVRFALDDARQSGRQVKPTCTYVASWVQRHPEYRELVA